MCGRYTLFAPLDALEELFDLIDVASDPLGLLAPRYNIAPTQQVRIIRAGDAGCSLGLARWGLIPAWRSRPRDGPLCINARSETIAAKPSFRAAFAARRALIPANGFFEWRRDGKHKQPFFFHLAGTAPFAFAGVWEDWRGGDDHLISMAIITAEANDVVVAVHPRMPVILDPTVYAEWLDPHTDARAARAILARAETGRQLIARPVSPQVNATTNEGAALIERAEPTPTQTRAQPSDDAQLDLF